MCQARFYNDYISASKIDFYIKSMLPLIMAENYHAIGIETPGDLGTICLKSLPMPILAENEILVQMEYSTINPLDMLILLGRYPIGPDPAMPGREGSGTVVQSGGSELGNSLLNKRVAVLGKGTWAEYAVAPAQSVFPLKDSITFEQAASLIINPMTSSMFLDKISKDGHKSVVQNASASSVGQKLIKLGKLLNFNTVNLVRRQEQVEILRAIGAEYVFNTSEEGWKERARELCRSLEVTIAFDAINGDATNEIADLVSDQGSVYSYGRLSGKNANIELLQSQFPAKKFEYISHAVWLYHKTYEEKIKAGEFIQDMIQEVFLTEYSSMINLNQLKDTLIGYSEASTTNNKILIRTRIES